ncbi:MAG: thermonuclease family protein [Nostocales cyanobacterium]|nr:MAG: thermonuclease family protein [Nostocales cyanobacterium]TAF21072.1 MAG: thermonuclease family protein [Nostocales cyanobacterium]
MKLIMKHLIKTGVVLMIITVIGCENLRAENSFFVERVSDGDTLTVSDKNKQKFTVRFACIDAPEIPHTNKEKNSRKAKDKNQFSWGLKAKERLQELIQQGKNQVYLDVMEKDRYGRKLAEVRLKNGTFIQQVLLQEGLVKIYRSYLNKCPSKKIMQQAETQAKNQNIGIWNDQKFIDPWEYRKLSK